MHDATRIVIIADHVQNGDGASFTEHVRSLSARR
jgi:hypothetical protein